MARGDASATTGIVQVYFLLRAESVVGTLQQKRA